jgi:D-aminopeptidase
MTTRARARDLGIVLGTLAPGALNAITDVAGVRVGHATLIAGERTRTGVTAILPHGDNAFLSRVPAAIHVGNGFGKLIGQSQVDELGELETPILLTATMSVWRVADALAAWMLDLPGMARVRSLSPVVGETNDGRLNDMRLQAVGAPEVRAALAAASGGPVAEGSVGAATGTVAFGWKGGIGTASRVAATGWTVGALVQSNFGGDLTIAGVPVGRALARALAKPGPPAGDGSIMMVLATDAPLGSRNLRRLAARAMMGLARTGSWAANGSGDYAIAFSTAASVRRAVAVEAHGPAMPPLRQAEDVGNDAMSALFQAAVEATEEAIVNSLLMATTVSSALGTVEAIPLDRVRALFPATGR